MQCLVYVNPNKRKQDQSQTKLNQLADHFDNLFTVDEQRDIYQEITKFIVDDSLPPFIEEESKGKKAERTDLWWAQTNLHISRC